MLETIAEALAAGRPVKRLVAGVAAWMIFIRAQARAGAPITDPLADRLVEIGLACDGEPAGDVARFLGLEAVFPRALAASAVFRAALAPAYGRLSGSDLTTALAEWLLAAQRIPVLYAIRFMMQTSSSTRDLR